MQVLSAAVAANAPEPEVKSFGAERTSQLIQQGGTPEAVRPGACDVYASHNVACTRPWRLAYLECYSMEIKSKLAYHTAHFLACVKALFYQPST